MTCRPAPSCKAALKQASALWPNRSTAGDGICAGAAHHKRNPNSDHEPDSRGIAHAFDLTHDPAHGCDTFALAIALANRNDPRVKYIISNRRIFNPAVSNNWRHYDGVDPHTGHMHVSVTTETENSTDPWWTAVEESDMTKDEHDLLVRLGTQMNSVVSDVTQLKAREQERYDDLVKRLNAIEKKP